jgi:DNA-binding transcriptional regulator YhcF (GntR family)
LSKEERMNERRRAFLSYSHADREVADRIAKGLQASGIDVWYDDWELLAGDSLIRKIEERIASADAFIVLLSEHSVESRWVQEELDMALIRRIEEDARVVPVVLGNVSIPLFLRPLLQVRMGNDFDQILRQLQAAIFEIRERPPVGQTPEFIRSQLASVGGLSRIATAVGTLLTFTGRNATGDEESFPVAEVAEDLELSPQEADDAIDELESQGLVETVSHLGTAPFRHGEVWPTHALFLHFRDSGLEYDPEEDIRTVASVVVAEEIVGGEEMGELTNLSPLRINRAVAYLDDQGLARIIRECGIAPFGFGAVCATAATRHFVAENCR